MKKIAILSGAGISAESGISTFRDSCGLWEGHDIMEVASPQGWAKNMELVLDFYNRRRKQALEVKPNSGHNALVDLEKKYDVTVITQNVDDLHERAGSTNVLHLHGELFKSRSTRYENLVYDCKIDIKIGDLCEKGFQLRPHIVWFGEMVPMIEAAARVVEAADVLIVVGTSLVVYPAAGLIDYAKRNTEVYVVDPNMPEVTSRPGLKLIEKKAGEGLVDLVKQLIN